MVSVTATATQQHDDWANYRKDHVLFAELTRSAKLTMYEAKEKVRRKRITYTSMELDEFLFWSWLKVQP